jgi:hypothetical protein
VDEQDEQEDVALPPLPAKTHPPAEMDDALPTLDDEVRRYHHHPNEAGTTEFEVDPEAADAAADLAGDFGSQFLEGATRGEDLSSRVFDEEDRRESEVPFLIEDGFEPIDGEAGAPEALLEEGEEKGELPFSPQPEGRSSRRRRVR